MLLVDYPSHETFLKLQLAVQILNLLLNVANSNFQPCRHFNDCGFRYECLLFLLNLSQQFKIGLLVVNLTFLIHFCVLQLQKGRSGNFCTYFFQFLLMNEFYVVLYAFVLR